MEIVFVIFFYIIASVSVFGALGVVFTHKVIYSFIYALLTFLCVGFMFVSIELTFLSVTMITLFVASSLVLLIISLMITKSDKKSGIAFKPRLLLAFFALSFITFITIVFIKYGTLLKDPNKTLTDTFIMPSSQTIAIEMFINYGAAFVFTALAFLSGIIGLGVFAQPVRRGKK